MKKKQQINKSGFENPPKMTPKDEKILDAIWDKIAERRKQEKQSK